MGGIQPVVFKILKLRFVAHFKVHEKYIDKLGG